MKKFIYRLFFFVFFILSLYGGIRLYFLVTGGFTLANITSNFGYQPQWETRLLLPEEQPEFDQAIEQPFYYLGKGCQSYVFISQDQQYVLKFFKYQRYRLQPWLTYFPSLPAIVKYREEKLKKKWKKLNRFVTSWKLAFDHFKEDSGLIFVHLNKTNDLQQQVMIYDKIGQKHLLDLDQMEFCLQRKVDLLEDTLLKYRDQRQLQEAKQLIQKLLQLIVSEYKRGLLDNDTALLQNTGVVQGNPIHIDVGQFIFKEALKEPETFHQELFIQTYRLRMWLRNHYPELGDYLETELYQVIGSSYTNRQFKFRQK